MTALEAVKSVDEMRTRLEREAEALVESEDAEAQALLADIYERLDKLEADNTEARAGQILHGLGFTKAMQAKKTRDFSGGWRMRIALARALFVDPAMLILDEPTNHLDLEACVWLEETLAKFERILILVSHSQDFMNGVCTNIIHMHQKQLKPYGGNYDTYVRTRAELEDAQMKKWRWEQDQVREGGGEGRERGEAAPTLVECFDAFRFNLPPPSSPPLPDRRHEGVHRPLRPRLRQAGPPGAVQGEDAGEDGAGGADGETRDRLGRQAQV